LERYHASLQRFHWVIALLVLSQLAVALVMSQLRSLQFGQSVIALHRQIGLLVMVLLLTRLALAWRFPAPKTPIRGLPAWQRFLAAAVHVAFMILLIVQPIIGVFSSWSRGDSITLLGVVSIPSPWDIPDEWHERLSQAHTATASLLFALIVMHVGAVIFNRYVRNVPVLERMLPGRDADKLVNRTPIAGQLTVGFSLLIAIMLVTGMYAVSQYRDATRRNSAMQAGELSAAEKTRAAQVSWKELVGRANGQQSFTPDDRARELAATAASKLNDALKHSSPGEVYKTLQALLGKIAAATPAAGAWRPTDLAAADADLQDVVDSESSNVFQLRMENEERTAMGHDLLVVTMVPTLVLGLLISSLLSRSITGSLSRMATLIRGVAGGQPAETVQVTGHGEFSNLMRDMLAMRAAVEGRGQAMLAQIQQSDAARARLAEESRVREATTEVRERERREQQRRQLTGDFETQVAGIVESVATTVANLKDTADRMAASAGNTSRSSRAASDMALQTSHSAVSIGPSAARLAAAATDFRGHAENSRAQAAQVIQEASEARTQIETLLGAARQIGSIAHEIAGIAHQTALLAINARIQAALAGAEGKGFAVVATEVKELATKTRRAVDGIGGQIEHVTNVANQSGEFLQRVLNRIETLESAAAGICRSADAQCASTADIAQRIAEVGASTQSVAQNIDAARTTASDTEAMATTVVEAAERMSREAVQLQDQVADFVLRIQGVGRKSRPAVGTLPASAADDVEPELVASWAALPASRAG
jgi:methyl-accepting chemotaxis protein